MPVDHLLTGEQRDLAEVVADFCRRECGTPQRLRALTDDGALLHNQELYEAMAELGWLGLGIDPECGGSGGGVTELCLFAERAARGGAPISGLVPTSAVAAICAESGTDEQRAEILAGVASGAVHSLAISEPEAGSDAAAVTCKAVQVDEGWLLNGHKTWCSNAHFAKEIFVLARTSTERVRTDGLTLFRVPATARGLTVRPLETMGAAEVNDLYLEDCFVPASAVVGGVGKAWYAVSSGLERERLLVAAVVVGVSRRLLGQVVEHVRHRRQFGQAIGAFQAVRHRLADLACEIECAETLVVTTALLADADPELPLTREISMAKLKATEVGKQMALEAVQLMGGSAFALESGVQQPLVSALAATVYSGTSEIQREIIGASYGL